jgi:hypothetical protein
MTRSSGEEKLSQWNSICKMPRAPDERPMNLLRRCFSDSGIVF